MVGSHGTGLRPQQPVSEKILPLPPSRQTLTDSVYEAVTELVMDQHIEAGARVNIDLVARSNIAAERLLHRCHMLHASVRPNQAGWLGPRGSRDDRQNSGKGERQWKKATRSLGCHGYSSSSPIPATGQ